VKKNVFEMTPRQIVRALDDYVIGQGSAKKAVAIALRNRWRRRRVEEELREEILPNNILMIGSTGVGKTEIARRLARLSGAPFVKVEASKFTEVGYVGRDVDSMIRDLMDVAVAKVRGEMTAEVEDEARDHVNERLLDLLLPPPPSSKPKSSRTSALDDVIKAMDSGDQQNETDKTDTSIDDEQAKQRRQRTRKKFLTKLKSGELDDAEVEIKTPDSTQGVMQMFGPMGMEEMGINIQEMLGPMLPRKRKSRKVTVSEAKSLLLAEEVDKLLDQDAIVREALRRTEENGIVFIDEIDKVAGSEDGGGGSGPDVSRGGVQRDILPIVEGTRVTTKYGPVRTDHILFIAAGAFHTATPGDLIPELQGRFPIRVELDNLEAADFLRILTEPRNALVKQYTALLDAEGVELVFEKGALKAVAEMSYQLNETQENIGARRLQTVMSRLLEEELFKLPSKKLEKVALTKKTVLDRLKDLLDDEDVSRYIL
jgi:ATP-dependent HslUV protease ATP-binding subunit HslU